MAHHVGTDNLIPMTARSKEEASELGRKGGIASGKARREKATMKATLEMLLNEEYKNGKTYRELATLGLLKGAISGNAQNYKTILEVLGELQDGKERTPIEDLTPLAELLKGEKK